MDKLPASYLFLFIAAAILAGLSVIAAALWLFDVFAPLNSVLIGAALNGFLAAIVIGALATIVRLLDEIAVAARRSSSIVARLATESVNAQRTADGTPAPRPTGQTWTGPVDYTIHGPSGRMAYRANGRYYATMDDALAGRNPLPD